jgi:hypothetical protein
MIVIMTVKLLCKDLQVSFGSLPFIHYHRRQWIVAYIMYLNDIPEEPDNVRQFYKESMLICLRSCIKIGRIIREEYPSTLTTYNYGHYISDKTFSNCQTYNDDYKCPFFEGLNIFVSRDIDRTHVDPSRKWTPLEIKTILKTLSTIRKYLKFQDRDNFVVEDEYEDECEDDIYFLENIFHYAVEHNEDIHIEHV